MSERIDGRSGRGHLYVVKPDDFPDAGQSQPPSFMPVHARATKKERRIVAAMLRDEIEIAVASDIGKKTDRGMELPLRRFSSRILPMEQGRVGAVYEAESDAREPLIIMRFTGMVFPNFRRLVTLELGLDTGQVLHVVDRQEFRPEAEVWQSSEPPIERISLNRSQLLVAHSIMAQLSHEKVDTPDDWGPYSLALGDYQVGALMLGLPLNSSASVE